MKKYFGYYALLICIALMYLNFDTQAQQSKNSVVGATVNVNVNDHVVLRLADYVGEEIKWQNSRDNQIWTDIPGATSDTLLFVADVTMYFRAIVTAGFCDPFISDITHIEVYQLSIVETLSPENITTTSASAGGNVISDGGLPVTARGVVWDTAENPTLENNFTTNGDGGGVFTSELTGLIPGTTYYVRAYATNGAGTSFGNQLAFTTAINEKDYLIRFAAKGAHTNVDTVIVENLTQGTNLTMAGNQVLILIVSTPGKSWIGPEKETESSIRMMQYTIGDRLKFTGIKDMYSTIIVDIPTKSKEFIFNLVACTDADGNHYPVVEIGNQIWMAENLRTTKYRNGNPLPNVTEEYQWRDLSTGAYCNYDNNEYVRKEYGRLYNWHAVRDNRNIAPADWHVPTDNEWYILSQYLGGDEMAGGKLKEYGFDFWESPNSGATNESGFSALPGGARDVSGGSFDKSGFNGYWWSSTQKDTGKAFGQRLSYNESKFNYEEFAKSIGLSIRCVYGPAITTVPTISTSAVNAFTLNMAKSGGLVISDGNLEITERGICWSTTQSPTVANSKSINGPGRGSFTSILKGLSAGETYYVRAYATNQKGTGYGNEIIFENPEGPCVNETGTMTDERDGNTYQTVKIGSQWWMAENLAYLPAISSISSYSFSEMRYYVYRFYPTLDVVASINQAKASENYRIYGVLYNWPAAMEGATGSNEVPSGIRGACPTGWHLPSRAEWDIMEALAGAQDNAGMLKTTEIWDVPNTGANNESCFSALPAGYANTYFSYFDDLIRIGRWWLSNNYDQETALIKRLEYNHDQVGNYRSTKLNGYSVRCIKDIPTVFTTTRVNAITQSNARVSGTIIWAEGASISSKGVCWGTTPSPTVHDSSSSEGPGEGAFSSNLTGLAAETTYYVRAYAVYNGDVFYGNEITFTTLNLEDESNFFIDSRDNNSYKWVRIGDQVWMAENLAYLPSVSSPSLGSTTEKHHYVYDYYADITAKAKANVNYGAYGVLYNWPAAMAGSTSSDSSPSGVKGICPAGWHLPSKSEWDLLKTFVGSNNSGKILKASKGWDSNGDGSDEFGFSALPGGYLHGQHFYYKGSRGEWWSSTAGSSPENVWYSTMRNNWNDMGIYADIKSKGSSIRCTKDHIIKLDSIGSISENSALCYYTISSDGDEVVTSRSVVWSITPNPTMSNNTGFIIIEGVGSGQLVTQISGLLPNTTYYVRVNTTSNYGADYSNQVEFTTLGPPLAAFIANPTSGFAPLTVNFTDQSTNNPTSWTWDFGDGTTSSQQNPAKTYNAAGTYTVGLTVSNNLGSGNFVKNNHITVNATSGTLTDTRDGQIYKWKKIGNQVWMTENLRYLPSVDYEITASASSPCYYVYGYIYGIVNEAKATSNYKNLGVLYNWPAAMDRASSSSTNPSGVRGACPTGWHLPSNAEWAVLVNYVGSNSGTKLKTQSGWVSGNGTDEFGFSARPGGRLSPNQGSNGIGQYGDWWTATEYQYRMGISREMSYTSSIVESYYGTTAYGYSVRCVKDGDTGNKPDVNFSGTPTSGTAPLTVIFTDQSTNNPTSWSWNFGDGTTSTQRNPTKTYTTPGTYTVALTSTNGFGANTSTRNNYITVSADVNAPVANFAGTPTSGTAPLTVNFTDQSTNIPTSWNWSFGDGTTSTQRNPTKIYTTPGTYTVALTSTNGFGSDINIKNNYVSVTAAGSAPVANFLGTPTSGTAPLTVNFTDQSTNIPTSWNWSFGDGTTSTLQNPTKIYTSPGTYSVALTATNGFGSDKNTKNNYVSVSAGIAPVANFSGTPTSGFVPLAVNFIDQSTNNPTSWTWDFGDGTTSTQRSPTKTYNSVGTYSVKLIAANSFGANELTKNNYIAAGAGGTFTDTRDGHTYKWVRIGEQEWMAENLNYASANSWCFGSNAANCDYYGRLYTWDAAMNGASSSSSIPSGVQGACPPGWHVPSDAELTQLLDYVVAQGYPNSNVTNGAGNVLKSCRQANSPLGGTCDTPAHPRWDYHGTHYGTDEFGFSALPGGYRIDNGSFNNRGGYGFWWSATESSYTESWNLGMYYFEGDVSRFSSGKMYGRSVRCVRD